jgi:acyl-CoA synthetase (AMP-forming)/AMP-acid ligase II
MNTLLRGLSGDAPLVAGPGRLVHRRSLAKEAATLAENLNSRSIQRLMVQSDDPAQLVVVLAAAECVRADVWIVHQESDPESVAAMVADFGIQWAHLDGHVSEFRDKRGGASSEAIHLMTSGTTGKPKVVRHTLESLIGLIRKSLSLNFGGRWLLTYQATSFAGMQVLLTALLGEGTLIVARQPRPLDFFEAAQEFQATHISGTPTFWRSFLLVAEVGSLPALQQITLGGEAVDEATLQRLRERFPNRRITHIYASTEAGIVFAVHDGRAGFPREWLDQDLQPVRLRVVEGMLEVLSPHRMVGYAGLVGESRADSWLRTGDLVTIEGDRAFFLGRTDDMINVGGAKVYPQQVEDFLLAFPGVADARVRGVKNPLSGNVLAADLVLEPGRDEEEMRTLLSRRCREELPGFQVPRILRFVGRIDVNSSGKKI